MGTDDAARRERHCVLVERGILAGVVARCPQCQQTAEGATQIIALGQLPRVRGEQLAGAR